MRFIFVFFILLSSLAWAQKSKLPVTRLKEISISALDSSRDNENDTIELEGQVQVIYQQNHLHADRARINMRSKILDAIGNVTITTPQASIGGDRVTLDYETNTGIIYRGYVQSGNVIFEGDILHKVSENSYIADKGKYTTCTNCPETWSFTGTRIRAELGGYAYIKNSVIRFGNVPSLWLPYLIVPLQSDRQTGLLTPGFEHTTKGGLAISNSFFWAIDRSQDSTITLKNYELRGLKSLVNYRYMLSENSQGEFDGAYMMDRAFANEKDRALKYRPSGDNFGRWFTRYYHYYDLPDGYVQRMQFNNASDLQYPSDFFLETQNNGDSAMESRTSLTKNTSNEHFSVDASYYINLLQADPFANNNFAVHRLPEIRYSHPNSRMGQTDFLYSFDMNYANFARNGQAWDTMNKAYSAGVTDRQLYREKSGVPCDDSLANDPDCKYIPGATYDPSKDFLRTGQRLDAQASLIHPILIANFLDVVPKISYRETHYYFPIDGPNSTAERRFFRGELASKLSFSRIYETDSLGRFKHEIQPELTASANSPVGSPSTHPFFGSQSGVFSSDVLTNEDMKGPFGFQFDYNDRLATSRLITFSLTNKLTRKIISGESSSYIRFLFWKMAQSYDFSLADSTDPTRQPYSDVSSTFYLYLGPYLFYQSSNYYPYQHVTNSSSRIRYTNNTGDFAEFEYKDQYNITAATNQTKINARDFSISFKKDLRWVDLITKITYNSNPQVEIKDRIQSSVFGAKLKLMGDCLHLTLVRYKDTRGDWNDAINFDFSWDGNKIPRIPDSIISSY